MTGFACSALRPKTETPLSEDRAGRTNPSANPETDSARDCRTRSWSCHCKCLRAKYKFLVTANLVPMTVMSYFFSMFPHVYDKAARFKVSGPYNHAPKVGIV